jgi:diguanylate cyclase (GGDEF)-like protein/PAS domain S-box-containing protein
MDSPAITAFHQAPAAVTATPDWVRSMLHALPWMAIATDVNGVIRHANPAACYQLGFTEQELLNRTTILLLHDLGQVQQRAVQLTAEWEKPVRPGLEALTMVARSRGSDQFDCDYLRKDGSSLPVQLHVTPLTAPDESTMGFMFTARERDFKPASPADLPESPETSFREFLDGTHDLVQSVTPEGHFLYVNRAWLRTLEYLVDDLPQLTLVDVIHTASMGQLAFLFKQALSGHRHSRQELILRTRSGAEIIVESSNSFSYENGRLTAIRSIFHDITSRKQQEQLLADHQRQLSSANVKLAMLATTDALTGLKNRRVFDERMDYECERAMRQKTPLSLLIMDVDHFKGYNDEFGHPAGDRVLQQLSLLLLQNSRSIDCVVRYGGEEFALILPGTPMDGALVLAERFRETVMKQDWRGRGITVSVGVACLLPQSDADIQTLIDTADHCLYEAKHAGRNRVFPAPGSTS